MARRSNKKNRKSDDDHSKLITEIQTSEIPFPLFGEKILKKTLLKIAIVFGGALFILILMQLGILEQIKPFILSYFYDYINIRYSPGSLDIGVVVLGLWLITGLSLIHPCISISLLCLLRCWLDGYTYPTDNAYFMWGATIVGCFFVTNTYIRRESLKYNPILIVIAIFVVVSVLLLPFSYQVGRSYRTAMLWISYTVLLIVIYNIAKNNWSSKTLVWALLITLGLQTWYAFLHYHYVLPFLRKSLMLDPSLRIKFFGTVELSRELIYRFNMNRAFGTMLFPNALAGFIILILPLCLSKLVGELKYFFETFKYKKIPLEKSKEKKVIFLAGGLWLTAVMILFITQLFPLTYALEIKSDIDFILAGAISILLAILPAGVFAWISITKGYDLGKSFIRITILGMCFFFGASSLWLTYSRGAWLSIMLSVMAFIVVRIITTIKKYNFSIAPKIVLLFPLCFIAILLILFGTAKAQSNFEEQIRRDNKTANLSDTMPSTQILEEGLEVTWNHLRDPSSFRLRWSYWKVGLSMFFYNFLTGVGLGNYGLAYPKYQYLGAGDVKECHNGYLQMLCETGILGGGLFIVFILLVLMKILKAFTNKNEINFEKLYIGIGILAFLIHAGLDIHFSHPSLVTYFVVLLGIFLSEEEKFEDIIKTNSEHRKESLWITSKYITPTFLLILIFFAIGVFPPYFRDLVRSKMAFINVGKDHELQLVIKTINFVFSEVLDFALGKTTKEPKISGTILRYFFVDLNRLKDFGDLYVPKKDGSNKAILLPEGEPVPEDCILLVKKPWYFIQVMKRRFFKYGEILERIDKIFPLQDDMPNYLGEYYKSIYIHLSYAHEPDLTNEAREKMLLWSRESLRRNPYHGDSYYNYGKALWYTGVKDDCPSNEKKKEYLLEALKYLEMSAQYWKNVPYYWYEYIEHLKDAKKAFSEMNEKNIVAELEEKEVNCSKYVEDLIRKRQKLGI
ncbi:MAG: O-antigen ligase family protein [Candidatus Hydrogenedentes bacterium]|nr:O-antigen ligase family protein [Candidatus Hydrogenedentota bacterium]